MLRTLAIFSLTGLIGCVVSGSGGGSGSGDGGGHSQHWPELPFTVQRLVLRYIRTNGLLDKGDARVIMKCR